MVFSHTKGYFYFPFQIIEMKSWVSLLLLTFFFTSASGQAARQKVNGWHLKDAAEGYAGISLQKAYALLQGKKSSTVIVAVIDSGIDTLHEDLRPVLWKNPKEIGGNGRDDDGNGYVDDVHGWNFCGSPTGENVQRNSHEVARVYHNWKQEFEGKKASQVPEEKQFLFAQWQKAASIINKDYEEATAQMSNVESFLTAAERSSAIITQHLSVTEFNAVALKPLKKHSNEMVARSAAFWEEVFSNASDTSVKHTAVIKEIQDYKNQLQNKISRRNDPPEDFRGALVKDRYTDINDRIYGNNNLKAGSGDHGTIVAGIIAAARNNSIGMDGIADNVRIMAIRAVPGGDEHDKDVALAIRYAVDNGARIINMSFGKPVSPYKHFVDEAVLYAASKGVLLVHAAGNDGKDITEDLFYPNPELINGKKATNFLTVGASGDLSTGGYAAPFSNYSNKRVDIFAPGTAIYSTATDNRYIAADGTSVAAPVVSGLAALLVSYFPELTPEQLISILIESGTRINEAVTVPGNSNGKKVPFSKLSSSGKIVNAAEAVKLAMGK